MSDFSDIPTAYPPATGFDSIYVADIATIGTLEVLDDFIIGDNLTVGLDISNQARINLNGAAGASRTFRIQTAGSDRWSIGSSAAESPSVIKTAVASVAAGNNVVPVNTTSGLTPGMQASVSGVTSSTLVSSAVGTTIVTPIAAATIASGSQVIPVNNTAGVLSQMAAVGAGIASSSVVNFIGGTTVVVTTTTTTNVLVGFANVAVASIAGIFAGMLASGTGIAADTYVTGTTTGITGLVAVILSKNRTGTIPVGTTLTFNPAIVLSRATTGTVTSGDTITISPAVILSQNTTGSGIANGDTITFYPNTGAPLAFTSFNDAGAGFMSPIQISRATGIANFSEGITIIPPVTQAPNGAGSFQPLLFSQSNWSGHAATSGNFVHYYQINIASDSSDLGSHGAHGFLLSHTYGGAGFTGGRVGFAINMQQTAGIPTVGGVGSDINSGRIGLNVSLTAGENAGGTAPTNGLAAGTVYAVATYSRLLAGNGYGGATNYQELNGWNLNMGAQVGTSVAFKHAINVGLLSDDAVRGTQADTVMQIAMQPGPATVGVHDIFLLGNINGEWASKIDSNLWGTQRSNGGISPMLTNYGLNWSDIAFNTAVVAAPGLVLAQGGSSVGALVTATTGNTTTLDTTLAHVTNTVIASSPTNLWQVGMGVYDASGNQWLVTATSASPQGTLTGISAVPIGPAYVASPPSNPVTVTDQSGQNTATLTLTWSTAPGLSICPTSQRIGFNGTAPIAKPTMTGSKGGNAAVASIVSLLASYGLGTDSTT